MGGRGDGVKEGKLEGGEREGAREVGREKESKGWSVEGREGGRE